MNLKLTCTTAAFAWALCAGAVAQTTSVAYVDIDRVTEKSEKINTAMGSVKGRVEDIQKEIESKRARLVEIRSEIKKGEGVLADSELKKKRDEAAGLDKKLVDLEYEGRRELQKLDTTLFEPMIKTIVLAIQDVAREKKIDLVVRGEAVIYGTDSSDITNDVIKMLNSQTYMSGTASKSKTSSSSTDSSSSENDDDEESTGSSRETESKVKSGSSPSAKSDAPTGSDSGKSTSGNAKIPMAKRPVDRQQD